MNDFVQFTPILANQERARRFLEIRNRNEKNGLGKTEIVTLKAACVAAQTAKYEKRHYHYIARKGICQ